MKRNVRSRELAALLRGVGIVCVVLFVLAAFGFALSWVTDGYRDPLGFGYWWLALAAWFVTCAYGSLRQAYRVEWPFLSSLGR